MALIVEDGTGKVDAESYASVSDADAYHSRFGNTSWAAASEANKELALRKATRYIDLTYRLRWKGTRTNETQALDWPMYGVIDADDFLIERDEIPEDLKLATIEAALKALTEDLMPDITTDESAGVTAESVKVGPIEISQSFNSGGKSIRKRYSSVENYLASITNNGWGAQRG